MILIAGGSGTLGAQLVHVLAAREATLRLLTRDPARARHLMRDRVEIAHGDVRDPVAVARAVHGVRTVISAVHGFTGARDNGPRSVDREGNRILIKAARAAGVEHFILVSVHGAAPDHPMELMRMKYAAEQELRASGLSWTIVRATAFMETWARVIGEPLIRTGSTRIFGKGTNPINFVSVHDVARVVAHAACDPAMRGALVELGGPENLSLRDVAVTFEAVLGRTGRQQAVPLALMRVMAVLMRPLNAALARQIEAGVVMDTTDMTVDPASTHDRYSPPPLTTFADVVKRDYGNRI